MSVDTLSGVSSLAEQWSYPVSREMSEQIGTYVEQLLKWNKSVNLTGARDLGELLGDHLPDSFAMARLCPPMARVVDVGSGGGLPAIPFAILRPDCKTTLLEPRAKRVAFLNTAVRGCRLRDVQVYRGRAEEVAAHSFTVASSRATFSPDSWLEIAPDLLAEEGFALVFATSSPPSRGLRARLVDSVAYASSSGSPRWCGSFRFT